MHGRLFVSEFHGNLDEGQFLRAIRRILDWACLSEHITLHSLRRYSLNHLAKVNLLGAQQMVGHKETRTTLLYTRIDADNVRGVHERANVVEDIVQNKREFRKERKRLY